MGRLVCVAALLWSSVAVADGDLVLSHRWRDVPVDTGISLEDQITDHLSEIGNVIGGHMNVLSDNLLSVRVDGRHNRAHLLLGGGNVHFLTFKVDSDWLFGDGKAHVKARVELGLAGHHVELRLPDVDVIPDNYRGQDLVQVNISLLERRF